MQFKPHSYQQHSIEWVSNHPKSGLILDMGMGKTVITLTAINDFIYDYFNVSNVLIIAPLRVADMTWSAEVEKWQHLKHLKISKVLGNAQSRLNALETKADIYVINRENVVWLVEHYGRDWPFDMVVVDEWSSFKSSNSKRFRALKKVMPLVERFIGLTGTPTPNGLLDLWPQMYLLDQGERLGKTLTRYRDMYFQAGRRNVHIIFDWDIREGAEQRIYEKISDVCMSLKAEDWLNVPERINHNFIVNLPPTVEQQYKDFERESILMLEEDKAIIGASAGVVTNKLLQFANGAVYDDDRGVNHLHDAKLDALEELIEGANGKPVLIFYSYKHDFERITKKYPDARTLEKEQDLKNWNEGKTDILICHPASVGHGLNLQDGGNIIIWFGLSWSLELYQQANARLHRQGQKQKVFVHHILAKGTVDEDVMKALENKNVQQNELIEAVKARIKGNEL